MEGVGLAEDAGDVSVALDLPNQTLLWVGAPDLLPVSNLEWVKASGSLFRDRRGAAADTGE